MALKTVSTYLLSASLHRLGITPDKCPEQRNQVNVEAFRSGEYPLSRRLMVIVKQNEEFDQQAGVAYANLLLTSQGQELIEKAGFVRIR